MNARPVRLGLVGLSGINGWMYAPAIRKHPDAEVVAGCDPDPEAIRKFQERVGAPTFASLPEMAAAIELDGVVVGTPNHVHLTNIREAAAAGLPVLVTKPIANTVTEGQEALAICREAGIPLAVAHEYRYRESVLELRRRVVAGEIGEVTMAHSHMGHLGGLSHLTAAANWRTAHGVPGGCANLLGVHCFDVLNALLGRPVAVTAIYNRVLTQSPLEDTVAQIVEYEHGRVGTVTSSYVSAPSDWVHVYGSQGNLRADTRTEALMLEEPKPNQVVTACAGLGSGYHVVTMFTKALREGKPPEVGGQEGLLAVALLEAGIIAAREQRRVTVDEVLSQPASAQVSP